MSSTAPLNISLDVTSIGYNICDLHMTIFWFCVAIFLIVFGIMIYSLIRHRKSTEYQTAKFHEHRWLEIVWTIIPMVILIAMAVPATKVLINMHKDSGTMLATKITNHR